jgi:hypothetical protein
MESEREGRKQMNRYLSNENDNQETVLQSGHREWIEEQEQELQRRDQQVVERFLAGKLKRKA